MCAVEWNFCCETHVSILYAGRMTINTIQEEKTLLKLSRSADVSPQISVNDEKKFVYLGAQNRIKTF